MADESLLQAIQGEIPGQIRNWSAMAYPAIDLAKTAGKAASDPDARSRALSGAWGAVDGFGPPPVIDAAKKAAAALGLDKALDARAESVMADNEKFRQSPLKHVMSSLLFGANAIGAGGAPGARPMLARGSAPPAGDFLRPSAPAADIPPYTATGYMNRTQANATNPVEGFKDFATMSPYLDPKQVAARYRNILPDPGRAAAALESTPAATAISPNKDAAALLRRNEGLVDVMRRLAEEGQIGPWGARP